MAKGKHITLDDIAVIIENKNNRAFAVPEEDMLVILQHIASCSECLERVKAHRRLDILLENWSPDLHGQAYRKMEYMKQQEKSKEAVKNGEPSMNPEAGETHNAGCSCGHEHGHGGSCDCGCDGCGDD